MEEISLTDGDRKELKSHARAALIIGYFAIFFLLAVFALIFATATGVFTLFSNPAPRYGHRFLWIALMFSILLFIPIYQVILFHLDLHHGKKIVIKTNNYQVVRQKNKDPYLNIGEPVNRKIEAIPEEAIVQLKVNEPITIEITKYTKELLFISNGSSNLLNQES